ncbi:MAG TPA: nitrous oxide reductase accessory protein NosL [Steroidobacteraceae bacterium]|nr:nitrous oxide reductase accessory protein NosL [Steroidobacteraceae bacterium]
MTTHFVRLALTLACGSLLIACNEASNKQSIPQEIGNESYCSLDGMPLVDYPGPKAQIHYSQGEPDLFCDTVELFAMYLQPEQEKHIVALFVQDMSKNDWEHPTDAWIDARSAYYVWGSKRHGSMGPTLASFAKESDAKAFARTEGGEVLAFDQITLDKVTLDGGVLKDRAM